MKATGMVQISTIINVTTQQDYKDYWTDCDYMIRCTENTCKRLSLRIAIRATEHKWTDFVFVSSCTLKHRVIYEGACLLNLKNTYVYHMNMFDTDVNWQSSLCLKA